MPIKITDYEWDQNKLSASIKFGLRNSSPKNVDIIYTNNYLKANFNPYIFEVFLRHEIVPKESSVMFKEGNIQFNLIKAFDEMWDALEISPLSKEAMQVLRLKALKDYEHFQNRLVKENKEMKSSLERLAISKQISFKEEKQAEQKELIKLEELKFFSEPEPESINKEDRMRLSSLCSEDGSTVASEGDYDGDEESVNYSSCENLHSIAEISKSSVPETPVSKHKQFSIPKVRENCCFKIRFTPHKPSIPKRESISSSLEEENSNVNESDASVQSTESQVKETLNTEATKFFESGDFSSAVKIYSTLIEKFPSHATYYSNRAAAFVALNSYKEAVNDCTKALDLLRPPKKENEKSRLLCYIRRGTSHVRLRDLSSALIDFEAAFRLDPNNVSLAKDAAAIRESLKACTDTGEDSSGDSQISSEEEEDSEHLNSQEMEIKIDEVEETTSDSSFS